MNGKECDKCHQSDPEPEIQCSECIRRFHKNCVPERLLRGDKTTVCELCKPFVPQTRFSNPVGHSTVFQGSGHEEAPETQLERMTRLEEALKEQTARFQEIMDLLTARSPISAPGDNLRTTQGDVSRPDVNQSSVNVTRNVNNNANSSSRSLDASLWRTRLPAEFVSNALSAPALTKEQLTRRKQGTELPAFNGDPMQWLTFIRRYLETAGDMCGFSATEDMKRIKAALCGPALSLVEPYMCNPENLDAVVNSLQQNFGQRFMLLDAMAQRIKKLPALSEDLCNIGKFAGEVDHIRIVSNMDPDQPVPSNCVAEIESKLPDRHADKWLDVRGMHNLPEINALADFLMDLHARQIALRRTTVQIPTSRPVLFVQEETPTYDPESSSLVTESSQQPPRRSEIRQCYFKCMVNHLWSVCPKFREMDVKARWFHVRRHHRCFACLDRHVKGECKTEALCNQCQRRHHPLLHPQGVHVDEVVNYTSDSLKTTFFKVLPVDLIVGDKVRRISCLMDSASSVTLLEKGVADELGLHGVPRPMTLSWADGGIKDATMTAKVSFKLRNHLTGQVYDASANTYENIRLPASRVMESLLVEEGLAHLPIAHDKTASMASPVLLIGQDNGRLMRVIASWEGRSGSVIASETPLGFALEGETRSPEIALVINRDADQETEKQAVLKDHHVEDHLDRDADEATLLARAERVRDAHGDGSLKLHKFQSNSKVVSRGLGTYEEADEKVSLSVSSILGLFWNTSDDLLSFRFSRDRFGLSLMDGYVENQMASTELTQWGWVPTDQNPADWGAKWMVTPGPTELWWRGPSFLLEQQDFWPSFEMCDRELLEVRPLLITQARSLRPCLVPEVERFPDWGKFVETCAVALKFIRILKKTVYPGPITEEERRLATAEIFLEAQRGLTERVDQKRSPYRPPFSFVGLDFFGPIEVASGRRHEKRWVALFKCLTTRAMYLELATSLSSNSCMAALDCLATRRGIPRRIHSDNATCFVAAAKEYHGPNGTRVEWQFIPPNSPSMGGSWERLVGAVQSALSNMNLSRTPSEETLRRVLQAERLLNSRPLTQIPVDPEEEEESLTPNHFLLGSSSGIKPEATRDDVLGNNWQVSFWQRFLRKYGPIISMRAKWFKKVRPLQVGDLGFICDQDHRGGWKRGRITKVATDSESGQVRAVVVETGDGRSFRRGACSVAPILRNEDLLVEDRKSLPIQNEEKQ